jgi:alpha-beta hydrolase superfamily lysophospholipase
MGQPSYRARRATAVLLAVVGASACLGDGPKPAPPRAGTPLAGAGKASYDGPMHEKNPLDDPALASAVFFPRPDDPFGPQAQGAYDRVHDVDGARIRLRVFPGPQAAPVILFFHGNGETARDYDHAADDYRALPATLIVAEYRGYGSSTGHPSLRTFLGDAARSLDEAKRLLAADGRTGPVVVMGRSLGSAPAIDLAASRPADVKGLVVESGFARMVPLLELLGIPARRLGVTEADGPQNERKMGAVTVPTLVMHAEEDRIIPIADADLLLAACKDPKKAFVRVPGAGHNDIQLRAGVAYFDAIRALLARVKSGG